MKSKVVQKFLVLLVFAAPLLFARADISSAVSTFLGWLVFLILVYLIVDATTEIAATNNEQSWKFGWVAAFFILNIVALAYFYFWAYPRLSHTSSRNA